MICQTFDLIDLKTKEWVIKANGIFLHVYSQTCPCGPLY